MANNHLRSTSFQLSALKLILQFQKIPLTRSNSGRKRKTRQLSFTSNNQGGERTPELDDPVFLGSEDSQDFAEDPYFEWSVKDIKAMEAHQIFHQDYYDYIEKLKKYHFKDLGKPPKRPKCQLPTVNTKNKTKQMLELTGEKLNLFLKEHLVEDNPLITPANEDFLTTNLGDAQIFLKQAYQTMQVSKAKLLTATLNVGLWLNKGYALFEIEKIRNPDNSLTWSG